MSLKPAISTGIKKFASRVLMYNGLMAFLLFPLVAMAAKDSEDRYQVEIIVFKNLISVATTEEEWPERPGYPSLKNTIEIVSQSERLLDDGVTKLKRYFVEPFDAGEETLDSVAAQLDKSKQYQVMIHKLWIQTAQSEKSSRPAYISDDASDTLVYIEAQAIDEVAEKTPEDLLMEALRVEEQAAVDAERPAHMPFFISELDPITPLDLTNNVPQSKPVQLFPMGPPMHQVFGNVTLFKERYLHLAIDFLYLAGEKNLEEDQKPKEEFPMATKEQKALTDTSDTSTPLLIDDRPMMNAFRLQDSKRVRLNKIYYFDHPMFGVIALVTEYKEPDQTQNPVKQQTKSTISPLKITQLVL